jgi:glycosyltransferase involved in cell wall biosynthesis
VSGSSEPPTPQNIVYYVDSEAFGGTEQTLIYLFAHLDRARWNPILIYHPNPGMGQLLDGARRHGVTTRPVPRPRGVGGLGKVPGIARVIRKERPALFHAHQNWLLSCKFGLMAARLARVPLVVATLQQILVPPWKRNVYWQQRIVSKTVDQYVAVALAVADQLTDSFRVPGRKVEVLHNGVPVEVFASRPKTGLDAADKSDRRPVVLTVGRLDDQKGHGVLLEAAQHVPDATFLLAGEGENRGALQQTAERRGISNRVVFLGHRSDIPDLLTRCDLFVLPSLYEAFPLSVLEAMAAGTPVVATAVGGTPEAVEDGVTGYLVPPGDATRLAAAINMALADPRRRRDMGRAAQERVARYSVAAMVERYTRLYDDLVTGNRPSRVRSRSLPKTGPGLDGA